MQQSDKIRKGRRKSVRWLNSEIATEKWPTKRRNVIIAFWCTILLGLPLWHLTTQVSRAPLPAIPQFESFKPKIHIQCKGGSAFTAHKVTTGLNLLQSVHEFTNQSSEGISYTVDWQLGSAFSSKIIPGTRVWEVRSTEAQSHNLEESLMANLLAIFEDERSRILSNRDPSLQAPDLRVAKYNPAYDLVFSLLNGGGEQTINTWPIQSSLEKVLYPTLDDVGAIANFSTESQVQHYAQLTFEPIWDSASGAYILQKSDLKSFINSAEWNLASAQSESKPLNFIVYVPKPEHRPLIIMEDDAPVRTNSFLLPQFGAIVIYNPPNGSDSDTFQADVLDELIEVFTAHFLTLLGLPSVPAAFGDSSRWRRDGLLRQRLSETMTSAQQTLQSIPKIVSQIPNIHVPVDVATSIEAALDALKAATSTQDRGNLEAALQHAKIAVRQAEAAFFNHKMVSLLYFPEEHKYGVYMPLFGPLFLPLLLAALKEVKLLLQRNKKRKEDEVVEPIVAQAQIK